MLLRIIRRRGDSSDATMVKAALETVLRRDRIVVAAALAVLAALAWGYVLWLGADMNMGGFWHGRDAYRCMCVMQARLPADGSPPVRYPT